jgi:hypothetical protein
MRAATIMTGLLDIMVLAKLSETPQRRPLMSMTTPPTMI